MKKPIYKRIWFWILIVIIIIAVIQNNDKTDDTTDQTDLSEHSSVMEFALPSYKIGESSEYVRDSKLCISYRVAVSVDLTDEELNLVYEDVVKDDDYYLHSVYFYSSLELANGGNAYDVALLEELEKDAEPEISRP